MASSRNDVGDLSGPRKRKLFKISIHAIFSEQLHTILSHCVFPIDRKSSDKFQECIIMLAFSLSLFPTFGWSPSLWTCPSACLSRPSSLPPSHPSSPPSSCLFITHKRPTHKFHYKTYDSPVFQKSSTSKEISVLWSLSSLISWEICQNRSIAVSAYNAISITR